MFLGDSPQRSTRLNLRVAANRVLAETVRLSIEKLFVVIGGGGVGMVLYGLIWRKPAAGIEPIPFNAYRFQRSAGNLRLGIALAVLGWFGAAVAYLI
jgi:hypothetical protein